MLIGMNTASGQAAGDAARNRLFGPSSQPLVVVLAAFCAGICLDRYGPTALSWAPAGTLIAWLWWGGSAAALLAWWRLWRRHANITAGPCLLLAVGLAAAAWHHTNHRLYERDNLGRFARLEAEPVCLHVRAAKSPERIPASDASPMRSLPTYDRTRLVVDVEAIRDSEHWRPTTGRATLTIEGHLLGVSPGDRLKVFAQLSRPAPPSNPGEFDFAQHLRRQRQTSRLFTSFPDCVTRMDVNHEAGLNISERIASVRSRGEKMLFKNIDQPRAGLASALLLGQRAGVERDTTEAFVQTGTVHLLAISGLHVGILASALMLILRLGWLPQRAALLGVIALTISYAFLADARPSVVRAAILVVVFCFSIYLGRPTLRFNTLAAAGLVVLLFQPLELCSMGTQLSFLAVGTLICAAPMFERWQQQDVLTRLIESTRPWPIRCVRWCGRWYWRLMLAGLAIWLVTLPLIAHNIHLVSPAGVIATPLLYLPLALALISGLGVLLFGWIAPPIAALCGDISGGSIALLNWSVAQIRDLPGSFYWVAGLEPWWIVGFYAGLIAWALCPAWRPPRRWCFAMVGLWVSLGFAWPAINKPSDQMRCTFIDVGHGCSVAMELPDDRLLLYDAGRLASPQGAARSISSFLWSRGRTHIDAIVISHADVDHYNAVPDLLDRFSVGVIYVSPVMLEAAQQTDVDRAVRELFRAVNSAEVPVKTLQAGQRLAGGEVKVDILHPSELGVLAPDMSRVDNANSLVLAVEYAGRRILLPGDLESPGSDDLMAEEPWDCDVLLAPHHGSPRSNPPGFAAWSKPEWTVVSGRRGTDLRPIQQAFGPPSLPNGHVLHTAGQGAITFTVAKNTDQKASNRPPTADFDSSAGALTVRWHLTE